MPCIVQKYGGSSVADTDKLQKIARLIANVKGQENDIAVVVSAMGKTTDELVMMARYISPKPPRREMDMLLSTGERITMSLLCMALHELGLDAVSLTGSQAGIITNDRHNDAQVIEVRPFRVQDEMDQGKVVIIGGFQGVSYKRDITTLGRGGSDTTAVALAAALDAERCEIYSDVDGVYSADPSIVSGPRHLPEISYPVMQEMSMAGAKVLHAGAVQFAKDKNIAIFARSAFNPGRETVIRRLSPGTVIGVQAVVSEKKVERIRLQGIDARTRFKLAVEYLETEQVPIKEVSVAETNSARQQSTASFVVSTQNIYGWKQIKAALINKVGQGIEFDTDLAALSLIGEGLNRNNLTLLIALDLMSDNRIPVCGIATTSFRISLLVPRNRIEKSVQLCHNRWVADTTIQRPD
ncbi:MAG: aspartate kinase [Deltaproteobacteria bacterium]|jgi:aspartate kinase|nr:aspartate kinase [Deltaproteobacteria bacterium]